MSESPQVVPPDKPSWGWQGLSRKLASRTTDLLAIAIILAGGLVLGRQVLEWWAEEPVPVSALPGSAEDLVEWGADDQPVQLEFGTAQWRLTRQNVSQGGMPAAVEVGRQLCRRSLERPWTPVGPPDAGEQQLLQAVSREEPELEQPGDWRMYLLGGGLPMIVLVRDMPAGGETEPRVASWGLAYPLPGQGWVVYAFQPASAETGQETATSEIASELSRLMLPPGGERVLSLGESGRAGIVHLRGPGSLANWRFHLTGQLKHRHWQQLGEWITTDGESQGRWSRATAGLEISLQDRGGAVEAVFHWMDSPQLAPED